MLTRALFIPCTPESQDDINAILAQPGVEYVDMKTLASTLFGRRWLRLRSANDGLRSANDWLRSANVLAP